MEIKPNSNFDEFRMLYNEATKELLILGGFIYKDDEVKFLDTVLCLNISEFL